MAAYHWIFWTDDGCCVTVWDEESTGTRSAFGWVGLPFPQRYAASKGAAYLRLLLSLSFFRIFGCLGLCWWFSGSTSGLLLSMAVSSFSWLVDFGRWLRVMCWERLLLGLGCGYLSLSCWCEIGWVFWYVNEPVVLVKSDVSAYFYGSGRWVIKSPPFRRLAVADEDAPDTLLGPLWPQGVGNMDIGN